MFGNMKQLMEMKKQADRIKKELDGTTIDCEDVKGVKIVINGSQILQSLEIDESYLGEGNKEKCEQNVLRAVNAAIKKSQQTAAKKMASAMPGM